MRIRNGGLGRGAGGGRSQRKVGDTVKGESGIKYLNKEK